MLTVPFALVPDLKDAGPTWLGIDDAWIMTLNHALLQQWTWGKDIVYTYGPLGFLATRLGYGIPRWLFAAFDLFIVLNFFWVFRDFIRSSGDKFLAVLFVCCITLLVQTFTGVGIAWIMLFLLCFCIGKLHADPRLGLFLYLSLLITLSFFLKLNTGLIGALLHVACLLNLYVFKKIPLSKAMLLLPLPFLLIVLAAIPLHVSLPGYIRGAFEVIKGYNDVMYLHEDPAGTAHALYLIFYALLLFYLVIAGLFLRNRQYIYLLFAGMAILYVFLLKKQAVIRSDAQHIEEFYAYSSLILMVGSTVLPSPRQQRFYLGSAFVITLATLLLFSKKRPVDEAFTMRYGIFSDYTRQFGEYDGYHYLDQAEKRYIPSTILQKIGKQPVDIFPWDINYALRNMLHYQPRPVFQSFSTYTDYLQRLNQSAYEQHAPAFILYDYDAIDNRHPFNDELAANLFIVKNYQVADTFTSNGRWLLLLEKKATTSPVHVVALGDTTAATGTDIRISDSCTFLSIDLDHTFKGRLQALWDKPPQVQVLYEDANGNQVSYRTSRELLKAGIMVRNMLSNNHDFANLITHDMPLERVQKIRLITDSGCFAPHAQVHYFHTDAIMEPKHEPGRQFINYSYFKPEQRFDLDKVHVVALWGGEVSSKPITLPKGTYRFRIVSKGTPAEKVFPHVQVFVGDQKIASYFTPASFEAHEHAFTLDRDQVAAIRIQMDNDLYLESKNEDRNAFIREIVITRTGD